MCLNKRVLIGLGAAVLVILAISPRALGSAAPLLMFAVCPLSMIFMMRGMNRQASTPTGDAKEGAEPRATPAVSPAEGSSRRMRELEEEVNRLKAEIHLRDQERSS